MDHVVYHDPDVDYSTPLTDDELGIDEEERGLLDNFVITSGRCFHLDAYFVVDWNPEGVARSHVATRACLSVSSHHFSFWGEEFEEAFKRVRPYVIKKLIRDCARKLPVGDRAPLSDFFRCDDDGQPVLTMWRPGR